MRALIILALLGCAFAFPKSLNRIVGGQETTVDRHPFMSNMQYSLFGSWWTQYCGGTLLTTTVVLSAAHCYDGRSRATEWRVRLGTSFASSGGSVHPVSRITMHEDYNSVTLESDVAIIRLSTAAIYSNNVKPARIAGTTFNTPDGSIVTAIGWGSLESNGAYPEQLHSVDMNVINQELCAARYAELKQLPGFQRWPDITDGMLCAGILDVGGKDACQGDSGGPLAYQDDIVVGVTSWGYGCADAYYPGVSARVSFYSDWIVNNA